MEQSKKPLYKDASTFQGLRTPTEKEIAPSDDELILQKEKTEQGTIPCEENPIDATQDYSRISEKDIFKPTKQYKKLYRPTSHS